MDYIKAVIGIIITVEAIVLLIGPLAVLYFKWGWRDGATFHIKIPSKKKITTVGKVSVVYE